MEMTGKEIFNLACIFIFVTVLPVVVIYAHRSAKKSASDLESSLKQRGYARVEAYQRHRGDVTWIVSQFSEAVPLYLKLSNRDGVALMIDQMRDKTIKTGNPIFDNSFAIYSNFEEIAKSILDQKMMNAFQNHQGIEFLTGAISNLLGVDYFPQQKEGRDLRIFWMLRIDGKLNNEQCQPYLALGQLLAAKIIDESKKSIFKQSDYYVEIWECR